MTDSAPSVQPSHNSASSPEAPRTVSFGEAFAFWLRLGFISFGGPAGQIAIMHQELVERRHWISEKRFLHALNYCMVLPGPEAQQLATYIGWLLHGTRGGIVAGTLFVLPSLFILMGLSAIYVAFGSLPAINAVLYGIKPAVVAIVVMAVLRIGSRAIKNGLLLTFAIAAFFALAVFDVSFPIIVLAAGLLGYLLAKVWPDKFKTGGGHGKSKSGEGPRVAAVLDDDHAPPAHARPNWGRFAVQAIVGAILWGAPIALLVNWQGWDGTHARMGTFFTTAALVTFGGAYAVLPFVAHQAVDVFGWMKPGQMIDGLALGETTPGPLIMVVSFVGFVGGWQATDMGWTGAVLGCLIATYFTFLPSFLFILMGGPFIEQMRDELRLTSALTGITAAVVGVILNLAVFFGKTVFVPQWNVLMSSFAKAESGFSLSQLAAAVDGVAVLIALASFVAMYRFKVSLGYVVAACALVGVASLLWR